MADQGKAVTRDSPPVCRARKAAPQADSSDAGSTLEILRQGQECPFCHFAELKRDGEEIVCPICGYGRRPCT